jgi:UDP-2,4-diacetamido-2,4,6-trideoxy-beta-L-altropyranose hydrolase
LFAVPYNCKSYIIVKALKYQLKKRIKKLLNKRLQKPYEKTDCVTTPRKVFIRADASYILGTGHIMRCLTLANQLRQHACNVEFLSANCHGNLNTWIQQQGFQVYALPAAENGFDMVADSQYVIKLLKQILNPDENAGSTPDNNPDNRATTPLLIVDHYGIDSAWEQALLPVIKKIAVIDDLANRQHHCQWLIDQNLNADSVRYKPYVPEDCQLLLGTQYCLIREEFTAQRAAGISPKEGVMRHIVVSFGGSDPTGETLKTLKALDTLKNELEKDFSEKNFLENSPKNQIQVSVVLGMRYQGKEQLTPYFNQPGYCFLENVTDMAQLLASAHLVIGAGGTSSWERCCMGVPAVVITVAENQQAISHALAEAGAIQHLGFHQAVDSSVIYHAVKALFLQPDKLHVMSGNAFKLVDGEGASRVAAALFV